MSQELHTSLVDMDSLSKPADTLIKKVSKVVGGLFEPDQIKRITKAKAEVALTMAQSEIQITDLHQRAVYRWIEEEAQRQQNIESITVKAVPHLTEEADPDLIEDDWIANFFDKFRIVSDGEMQDLWARVLAEKANASDTLSIFTKQTVNSFSNFDKVDVELFTKVCGFCWWMEAEGHLVPLIQRGHEHIYNPYGLTYGTLSHLDNVGLIRYLPNGVYHQTHLPKSVVLHYFGKTLCLKMPEDVGSSLTGSKLFPEVGGRKLETGSVALTAIGQKLAPICESEPVDGFWEYAQECWKQYLPAEEPE